MSRESERGAAAVEFAIVVPVLVSLLLGIMEFSRAYNAQASLSAAAREAVRVMATSDRTAAAVATAKTNAVTAAKNTAVSLQPGLQDSAIQFGAPCPSTIPSGTSPQATVTITYSLSTLTGIAGPFTMTAKGAMLCGG
ncbi:Flp pilus assembly protein TadG [Arthrobacter ulcerisalmonis]|nr:TadE/TadG family type IV pilus assembly protein [Arthrobacter ulcerisalmonis]MDQ0663509.1 Flp pilus assembly protein TadG [Arthrobacter ulcerisalmonis]